MPVEVESTSQVEELLRVLRKRSWFILVPFVLFVTVGTSFAVLVPKKYVAKTRVMVREVKGSDGKPIGQAGGKVASHVIRSPRRIEAVIDQLKWPWRTLTEVEKDVLREQILEDLDVSTPPMGLGVAEQIVQISFAHTDPTKAFEFVREISGKWMSEVLESTRRAKREAFDKLKERRGQMEKRLNQISNLIATKNKQYNIPPPDPEAAYSGERSLAPEFEELEELEDEQKLLYNRSTSLQRQVEKKEREHAKMDDLVPFVETEEGTSYKEQIDSLEAAILKQRSRLVEEGYKPPHSEYAKIQDKIRSLEDEIALLKNSQIQGSRSEEMRENKKKIQLGEQIEKDWDDLEQMQKRLEEVTLAIDDTKAKTRDLQTIYQELADLHNERQRLNENLTRVEDDYQQMSVVIDEMMTAAGDPFILLDPPKVPTRPTEPSPILIVMFAVFAGAGLGLGLAVLTEYGKSCFRNVNDITRVMVVPVLGTVNAIVTRRQRRRRLLARALVGSATLLVVAVLGFVTWAWQYDQELLSDGLRNSIESFREALG